MPSSRSSTFSNVMTLRRYGRSFGVSPVESAFAMFSAITLMRAPCTFMPAAAAFRLSRRSISGPPYGSMAKGQGSAAAADDGAQKADMLAVQVGDHLIGHAG